MNKTEAYTHAQTLANQTGKRYVVYYDIEATQRLYQVCKAEDEWLWVDDDCSVDGYCEPGAECLRCGKPASTLPGPTSIRGEAVTYCRSCEEMMLATLKARSTQAQEGRG